MPQSKTARWLDLIAYLLQHHYPVTREQIYEHVTDYRESLGLAPRPRSPCVASSSGTRTSCGHSV